jgi:hypothetical protein
VVPHGVLCSAPDCFYALLILMFSYQVMMLAPDRMCSFGERTTPILTPSINPAHSEIPGVASAGYL